MHQDKVQYGIELYDLLECVDFNNRSKDLAIEALLSWAERYINFSGAMISTIQVTEKLTVDFYYDKCVPKQWIKEYCHNDYAKDDPIIRHALNVGGVFSWSDAFSSCDTPGGREVIARARIFGLHRGYSFLMPVSNKQGEAVKLLSVASASSKSDIKCESIIATLGATAFYLMEHIIDNKKFACETGLSNKELQVLDWSAKGKSIWEISQIISTPERTVKHHLENTYRKLQASNKTQAVSTALKLGLIN